MDWLLRVRGRLSALKLFWFSGRQRVLDAVVTSLYGQPMQVLPKGHAALAGALVLWFVEDGTRHMVMVRPTKSKDNRARLVSCMGLGRFADIPSALKSALEGQLGRVFAKTIDPKLLTHDRVAAAPVFSFTDEDTGISAPVQVLAWVVQIQPVQVELIRTQPGLDMMVVAENVIASPTSAGQGHLSPTHRAIWQAVQRHMPKPKISRRADAVEEVNLDGSPAARKKAVGRILH